MAISKKSAGLLMEAHDLLGETARHPQTNGSHEGMCKGAMSHLKSVFQPIIQGGGGGREDKSPRQLTKAEREHCQAAYDVANHLAGHEDMHRAGKSMCSEAKGYVKTVLDRHGSNPGITSDSNPGIEGGAQNPETKRADALAAKLVGALGAGRVVSPHVLAMLSNAVDAAVEELPERALEEAFGAGQ